MIRPLRGWDRFWFEPRTARVLGLYRIVLGLLTLYSFALFAKDTAVFFSDAGVLTVETIQKALRRDCHSILWWIRSPFGVGCALAALFAAGILFTVGLWTRVSSILLFILVASFHERNTLVLNSGDTVLRVMLFYFMFAPAGAAFSVDGLRRARKHPGAGPVRTAPWAQRLMQIQVAFIYLATAAAKSRGGLYQSGDAMYYVFGLVDFHVRGVEQLMNFPVLCSFLTYATLFAEIAIPFLLWFRASRPFAVLLGLLLHGWIMFFMTLPVFGILMLATYLPFFTEEEGDSILAAARARLQGPRGQAVLAALRKLWRFSP